jgi:hypothetical protein
MIDLKQLIQTRNKCVKVAQQSLIGLDIGLTENEALSIADCFSARALALANNPNSFELGYSYHLEMIQSMKDTFQDSPYFKDAMIDFREFVSCYFGKGFNPNIFSNFRTEEVLKEYSPNVIKQKNRDLFYEMHAPIGGGFWGQGLPDKKREYYLKKLTGEVPKESLLKRWVKGNFSFIVETVPKRNIFYACC